MVKHHSPAASSLLKCESTPDDGRLNGLVGHVDSAFGDCPRHCGILRYVNPQPCQLETTTPNLGHHRLIASRDGRPSRQPAVTCCVQTLDGGIVGPCLLIGRPVSGAERRRHLIEEGSDRVPLSLEVGCPSTAC